MARFHPDCDVCSLVESGQVQRFALPVRRQGTAWSAGGCYAVQCKSEAKHAIAGDRPSIAGAILELRWNPNNPLVARAHEAERFQKPGTKLPAWPVSGLPIA